MRSHAASDICPSTSSTGTSSGGTPVSVGMLTCLFGMHGTLHKGLIGRQRMNDGFIGCKGRACFVINSSQSNAVSKPEN